MGDITSTYSNHVIFVLKSEIASPLVMKQEPRGWSEDSIRFTRHQDYHGIFTSFTNSLTFYKQFKDYINLAYEIGGINANLTLTKFELKDVGDKIKYVERYTAFADFKTKKEKDGGLSINFNSDELEELIKSHKSDTFEIERLTSIDNDNIDVLDLFKVELSGRTISGIGESDINLDYQTADFNGEKTQTENISLSGQGSRNSITPVTTKISEGPERFSSVDYSDATGASGPIRSSNMFFVRNDLDSLLVNVKFNYDIELYVKGRTGSGLIRASIGVYEWDGTNFNLIKEDVIKEFDSVENKTEKILIKGVYNYDNLENNQGITISYYMHEKGSGIISTSDLYFTKHKLVLSTDEFYEKSPSLSFVFFHDCIERLMYIITGDKNKFYSKYFGRIELGYKEDGEGGLMGLMSGLWARAFDPQSEKYKSLQTSLDECIKSAQCVHNIGVGIEKFNLSKRLRFEKLEYFYQNKVVGEFPYQLKNVVRTIDAGLFFSGTELGYQYGGEYEDEVGLDEPNTISENVTPIRKSDKKYSKKSKIRSDDYGLEITRRKPQLLFPQEDTSMDSNNWWLDLKRTDFGFIQKIWSDRLVKLPTGVNAPEDYKGMFFTPLRILFRHGFVIRSGLEPYYNKYIKNTNIKGNKNLSMHFIGEEKEFKENSDIIVKDLDRSRFTPDIIEGEHVITPDLLDLLQGTTKIEVNGEEEEVSNLYFPWRITNEKGEKEIVYILDINPKGNGKIKFQKYNDKLIKQ